MKKNREEKFFEVMEEDILRADIPEEDRNKLLKNLLKLKEQKINLMITGATGCGKSSTINALFNTEVAKVGVGVDPETMEIEKYELDNLVLWDSPGLGDGKEADNRHAKNIIKKLNELDEDGNLLIDLVLVILDGGSRDLGTSYELINKVIIPNLGKNKENRILVAINQADVAMKGRYWNYEENKPEEKLVKFLDEKVQSVQKRIKEGTGIDITPIYYCAGYKEEGKKQCRPYNLTKLLSYIIKYTPKDKRLSYVENINRNEEMWKDDDKLKDYRNEVRKSFAETVVDCAADGANIGGKIGKIFGKTGETVGKVIGGVVGGVIGVIKHVGGGCYITTATCEAYGKGDNCIELSTFRDFRDNWLLKQEDGEQLVQQYYDTAPALVDKINRQNNREEIYRYIHDDYLVKCLEYIADGENEKCKCLYVDMMNRLSEEADRWEM